MERKIKFIWDFYGADASKTAMHHAKHLKEYTDRKKIMPAETGTSDFENHSEAFVTVEEKHLIELRDQLRPQRGQWVEEKPKA